MAERAAGLPKTIELAVLGKAAETKTAPDHSVADLVDRIDEVLAFLKERASQGPSESPASVGGMEARIAHMEASAAHLQRDVAQIRVDMRDIRERLPRLQERAAHLPSKGLLALSVLALTAAIALASGFQHQLRALLAAGFG
jgi:hypothetical protein